MNEDLLRLIRSYIQNQRQLAAELLTKPGEYASYYDILQSQINLCIRLDWILDAMIEDLDN